MQRQRAGDGCQTALSSNTVSVQTAAARRSNSTVGDCRRLRRTRPTTTTITAGPWQWSSSDSNRSLLTPAKQNGVYIHTTKATYTSGSYATHR